MEAEMRVDDDFWNLETEPLWIRNPYGSIFDPQLTCHIIIILTGFFLKLNVYC